VPDIEERLTMAQVKVDFSGTTVFVAAGARLAVMSRSARRSTPP
jgi:hypothetical protein